MFRKIYVRSLCNCIPHVQHSIFIKNAANLIFEGVENRFLWEILKPFWGTSIRITINNCHSKPNPRQYNKHNFLNDYPGTLQRLDIYQRPIHTITPTIIHSTSSHLKMIPLLNLKKGKIFHTPPEPNPS